MPKRLPSLTRRGSPSITVSAGAFQVGGWGYDAEEARRIEKWLCTEVGLRNNDLQDPLRDRYRVARDPRSILTSLCGSLAAALVGASTELTKLEAESRKRVAWRKERRQYLNTIARLQALNRHAWAEELAQEVKQRNEAHTQDLRIAKKEIRDNLLCQCRDLIEQYTRLKGDRAWEKVRDILQISDPDLSEECASLMRQFERIPAEMKRNWKQRHSA